MNNTNTTIPVRDITAWATSEDLPPQDLFSSVENYRTFVKRWRELYKEITIRLRALRVCGRCATSIANPHTNQVRRDFKQREYDKYKPALAVPFSDDLRALITAHVPAHLLDPKTKLYGDREAIVASYMYPYGSDATKLLLIRQAGKRWVKQYHPWKSTSKAA